MIEEFLKGMSVASAAYDPEKKDWDAVAAKMRKWAGANQQRKRIAQNIIVMLREVEAGEL